MIRNKLVTLVTGLVLFSTGVDAAENVQYVIAAQKIFLRDRPNFLGKPIAQAKYGQKISVVGTEGSWNKVKIGTRQGWIHRSGLQESFYILNEIGKGNKNTKDVYKDEVVAAGKGFSSDYELLMKSQNPQLNFTAVDQIQNLSLSVQGLEQFGKKGELKSETFK